jgi:hypothetical protein
MTLSSKPSVRLWQLFAAIAVFGSAFGVMRLSRPTGWALLFGGTAFLAYLYQGAARKASPVLRALALCFGLLAAVSLGVAFSESVSCQSRGVSTEGILLMGVFSFALGCIAMSRRRVDFVDATIAVVFMWASIPVFLIIMDDYDEWFFLSCVMLTPFVTLTIIVPFLVGALGGYLWAWHRDTG